MTRAEIRCTAHLQASGSTRREGERQRGAAVRFAVGQSKYSGGKPTDGTAKPFEIIKAVRYKIAQKAAAVLPTRLPALQTQSRCLVFEVPGHDRVVQPSDRTGLQDCLGTPPRWQLRKVEIDGDRSTTLASPIEDHLCACKIGGKGLLEKHGFSELERALRDGRLEMRRDGHGDHCNRRLIDQCLPIAEPARNVHSARDLRR